MMTTSGETLAHRSSNMAHSLFVFRWLGDQSKRANNHPCCPAERGVCPCAQLATDADGPRTSQEPSLVFLDDVNIIGVYHRVHDQVPPIEFFLHVVLLTLTNLEGFI